MWVWALAVVILGGEILIGIKLVADYKRDTHKNE